MLHKSTHLTFEQQKTSSLRCEKIYSLIEDNDLEALERLFKTKIDPV